MTIWMGVSLNAWMMARKKKIILDQGFRFGERGKNHTLNSAKNDRCKYSDVPCHDNLEKLKNETIYGSNTPHAYKTKHNKHNYQVWPAVGLFRNSSLTFDSKIIFFKNLTENETKSQDVSERSVGKGASGGAAYRDHEVPLLTTDANRTYSRN